METSQSEGGLAVVEGTKKSPNPLLSVKSLKIRSQSYTPETLRSPESMDSLTLNPVSVFTSFASDKREFKYFAFWP